MVSKQNYYSEKNTKSLIEKDFNKNTINWPKSLILLQRKYERKSKNSQIIFLNFFLKKKKKMQEKLHSQTCLLK